MKFSALGCLLLAFAMLPLACGQQGRSPQKAKTSGTIQMDGVPISEGIVIFENLAQGISASTQIQEGKFDFPNGVEIGEYQVVVKPASAPAPHLQAQAKAATVKIPAKYHSVKTTPLSAVIKEGTNELELKVEGK